MRTTDEVPQSAEYLGVLNRAGIPNMTLAQAFEKIRSEGFADIMECTEHSEIGRLAVLADQKHDRFTRGYSSESLTLAETIAAFFVARREEISDSEMSAISDWAHSDRGGAADQVGADLLQRSLAASRSARSQRAYLAKITKIRGWRD